MTHLDLVSKAQAGLAKKIKNEGGGMLKACPTRTQKKSGGRYA
jgi:hypothetical protein